MNGEDVRAITGSGNPEAHDYAGLFDAECERYEEELCQMSDDQLQVVVDRIGENRQPNDWQATLAESVLAERRRSGVKKMPDGLLHHPV